MKRILIVFINVIVVTTILAQSPNSFKYQTVVRDAAGEVLSNQDVSFQFSILQGSTTGTSVYTETYDVTTNDFGLVNLNIGAGTTSDDFSTIDWGNGPFFIKVELDENGGTNFSEMGTSQLLSVPYAMYSKNVEEKQILNFQNDTLYLTDGGQIYLGNYTNLWQQNDTNIYYNNGWVGVGTNHPSGKMVVQGDEGVDPDSALFEVKNKDGQTIFAVYDGGVRIWVDDTGAKTNTDKGGFAVGGYRLNKSISSEYLRVTPDSVRVYIREDDGTKANTDKGGFAVGGYRLNKSTTNQYFNINPNLEADTLNPSEARIYWYPLKEAFMSGRVLVESVDSVGLNSWATGFESKSIGNYSQAMGYRARAKGNNSTAIGYNANADTSNSYALGNNAYVGEINSYAFGNNANVLGQGSYAIGTDALASKNYSFAIGSKGVDSLGNPTLATRANGEYSFAIGMGSVSDTIGAFAIGTKNIASGFYSLALGYHTTASGSFSTSIGLETSATGKYSTSLGNQTSANGKYSFVQGFYSEANNTYSIAMGTNVVSDGVAAVALGFYCEAHNDLSIAIGNYANAEADYSVALGQGHTTGAYSFAINGFASASWAVSLGGSSTGTGAISSFEAVASGAYSVAMGLQAKATALSSVALGEYCEANEAYSISIGRHNLTTGKSSKALGLYTTARAFASTAMGAYNDEIASSSTFSWVDTDPLFVIGNGYITGKHNAFTILKNGDLFLTKPGNNVDNLRFRVSGSAYDIDFFNHNLYFSGYDASTQLVAMMIEYNTGNIGIGTTTPDMKLTVDGDMRVTNDIYYGAIGSATTYNKPDFVFKSNYDKNYDIFQVEQFINKNGHLPWLTAAKDEKNGINMTKMSFQTLEAVENQQLQIIELKKENEEIKSKNEQQQKTINELIKRIEKLENKR